MTMSSQIKDGWTVHDPERNLQIPLFPYKVSRQDIADILCTALEGGSTYWLRSVTGTHPAAVYASDVPSCGGYLRLRYDDPEGDEGNGKGRADLRLEDMLRGISLGLKSGVLLTAGVDVTDMAVMDANAADAVLQYAVLGALVYG